MIQNLELQKRTKIDKIGKKVVRNTINMTFTRCSLDLINFAAKQSTDLTPKFYW